MSAFLILIENQNIKTYEHRNGFFECLKNNGEEEQVFDKALFWEWWRQKSHYQNEPCSFVLIGDTTDFEIPSFVTLSQDVEIPSKDIEKWIHIPSHLHLFSFPNGIERPTIKYQPDQADQTTVETREASLSLYFKQKTEHYKHS